MRLDLGGFQFSGLQYVLGVLGLSAVAVLIVLAVMVPRRSADTVDVSPPPLRYEWATTDRLVLPDGFARAGELEWVAFRPRREAWSEDQLAEYWLDPATIGIEVLDERVEEYIRSLLREVP